VEELTTTTLAGTALERHTDDLAVVIRKIYFDICFKKKLYFSFNLLDCDHYNLFIYILYKINLGCPRQNK